jgi:hypothetical protein
VSSHDMPTSTPTALPLPSAVAADFARNPPKYGTLISTTDSAQAIFLRLDRRATSWGRAQSCTLVHPDNMDRRIPKVCFLIIFHAPGIEQAEASGNDWTALPELHALIKNCSDTAPLWVNDAPLYATTPAGDDYCGRLCAGDVVTVFRPHRDGEPGEALRFVCDFTVGEARKPRHVPFDPIIAAKPQRSSPAK